MVNRRTSTLPVSGSTFTSTIEPANAPPTPCGLTAALPTMGPPVLFNWPASSLNVMASSLSALERKTPCTSSISSAPMSQMSASRSIICSFKCWAASNAAQPVLNVTLLPPVPLV